MTNIPAATKAQNIRTFLLLRQFAAEEIGGRIAQARREAGGLTQEKLAELLNVSVRSVQDYEAGITIPWKHFQEMAGILARPVEWFLHGTERAEDDILERLERIEALVETLVEATETRSESGVRGAARRSGT